jgi:hypothetical protein
MNSDPATEASVIGKQNLVCVREREIAKLSKYLMKIWTEKCILEYNEAASCIIKNHR